MRVNLAAVMTTRGVTHQMLASSLLVSRSVVSQYVSGKCTPPLDRAFAIARYLQVPGDQVEWLFENHTDSITERAGKGQGSPQTSFNCTDKKENI